MAQSPELAGGEGFTFEGAVAAFYLTSLFAEAYAPGVNDRQVIGVSVQQRDFGEPLDDVIVDFEGDNNSNVRLSLQAKQSLTVSDAVSNDDFREVIRDSWLTLQKPEFRRGYDRYGAVTERITSEKERALKMLCDCARVSLTAEHFEQRFTESGNANIKTKEVKDCIANLLTDTKGEPCSEEELHRFLAHFVIVRLDLMREGAANQSEALNTIKACLGDENTEGPPSVWDKFRNLARDHAGRSGQFNRASLVHAVAPIIRLKGASALRTDAKILKALAQSNADRIYDDIGGVRLERAPLRHDLTEKLAVSRFIQIRGLPGSGKSVFIRRLVHDALNDGPVLFLKAEQIEHSSWISFAHHHGLSSSSIEELLLEIGAMGTPVLFIDAIDRIEKQYQPLILDLLHSIDRSAVLDQWKVIVSLRDTGVEALQIWLDDFLRNNKIESLEVGSLNDEEARNLANEKVHLEPLLFGSREVREVARRPFFAKILEQNFIAAPSTPITIPKSELDLMKNWWSRGGYNEGGQKALKRQRSLIELASSRCRDLSRPIKINCLSSLDELEELRSDGILQDSYPGVSVSFSHDIFFEWAFLHALLDANDGWTSQIKACGEPPAVGRSVELLSQLKYEEGSNWESNLKQCESQDLRSQWLRAWLFGPFSSATFENNSESMVEALSRDESHLFRRLLVWFQAEKTTPNTNILSSDLPPSDRQMFAYSLSWPADFKIWRRMIGFVLSQLSSIPVNVYPIVVSVFEVWQNAVAQVRNDISRSILEQCASWLSEIDTDSSDRSYLRNDSTWKEVPDLKTFKKDLIRLLINASGAEPDLIEVYLSRLISSEPLRDDMVAYILQHSHFLAQNMPERLVDVTLASLKQSLPEEVQKRIREEQSHSIIPHSFGSFDWDHLSIADDSRSFYPESPLREPFHSLFKFSPQEAIRLVKELCNHAMTAWRQLHRLSHDSYGTPIPLKLEFPWGEQSFWGTSREYRFFRGVFGPNAISCGLMAMEDWAFKQIDSAQAIDDVLRQVVEENSCIAVLGIAGMIAMEKEAVSWTTLPLFTSQRLLEMDIQRKVEDLGAIHANLIGFMNEANRSHHEAVKKLNERAVRQKDLRSQIPMFIFGEEEISKRARNLITTFEDDLPFEYEEHRNIKEAQDKLLKSARRYAELADLDTYRPYRVSEDSNQIALVHESPSAVEPENIARVEEASQRLTEGGLWSWASKSFEEDYINDSYTLKQAIEIVKNTISCGVFDPTVNETDEGSLGMRRGAVAAVAAMTLYFRKGLEEKELFWARSLIERAINMPEERTLFWSPDAIISWHPCIFAARAIASEIKHHTACDTSHYDLLSLVSHPLECVSHVALGEAIKLWDIERFLSWAALTVALDLCHIQPTNAEDVRGYNDANHTNEQASRAVEKAFSLYKSQEWQSLPHPPPAWVKRGGGANQNLKPCRRMTTSIDLDEDHSELGESKIIWNTKKAEGILNILPLEEFINSITKPHLVNFLRELLDWTSKKNAPPWKQEYGRNKPPSGLIAWNHALGRRLGLAAGLLTLDEFSDSFLVSICDLRGEICWSILEPMVSSYICAYVYDSRAVPKEAVGFLQACLERFLDAPEFHKPSYRDHEFIGFDDSRLVRVLMFVEIEKAELASRFVNGDWTEVDLILPIVDRLIRAGAHLSSVVEAFVTLCERSKECYPAEEFSDQALVILHAIKDDGRKLGKDLIPARIAELVQYFSHRETPLNLSLAEKFLRVLDKLVDLGDRRAAALQLQETFREIRLTSNGQ